MAEFLGKDVGEKKSLNQSVKELIGGVSPMGAMLQRQNDAAHNLPTMETVDLDPETKKFLDRSTNEANQSPDSLSSTYMNGVPDAGKLQLSGLSGALQNSSRGLGGSQNDALASALTKRAQKSYGNDVEKIQRQSKLQAQADKFKQQDQIVQLYARKQNQVIQDANNQNQSILAKAQARNTAMQMGMGAIGGVIGGIFGMGGGGGSGNNAQAQNQQSTQFQSTAGYQSYGNKNSSTEQRSAGV